MKKEKESKTVINNWGFGEIFRYFDVKWIMKFMIVLICITAIVNIISFPVKIHSDIDCNSGDFNLQVFQTQDNKTGELETDFINLDGIKDMNCKAKVRIEGPLIGFIFT